MKHNKKELDILNYVLGIKNNLGVNSDLCETLLTNKDTLTEMVKHIDYQNPESSYSRQVLAREHYEDILLGHNFEIIIGHWKKTYTPCHIHGHPQFLYYQVLSGIYLMHFYKIRDPKAGKVKLTSSVFLKTGDVYTVCADTQSMSNCIHSIQCYEPGQTLHIYSNDATKGVRYKI